MRNFKLFGIIGGVIGILLGGIWWLPFGLMGAAIGMTIGAYTDYYHVLNSLTRIKEEMQNEFEERGEGELHDIIQRSNVFQNEKLQKMLSFSLSIYILRLPGMLDYLIKNGDQQTKQSAFWIADQFVNLSDSFPKNGRTKIIDRLKSAYIAQRSFENLLKDSQRTLPSIDFESSNNLAALFVNSDEVRSQIEKFKTANQWHLAMARIGSAMSNASAGSYTGTGKAGGIDFKKEIVRDEIRHELSKDNIYL